MCAREGDGWVVYAHGGRTSSGKDAVAFARQIVRACAGGGNPALLRWIGTALKDGYDIPLLRAIRDVVSVPLIASGGAGDVQHMADAVPGGRRGCRSGSVCIFHFGEATIADAKAALAAAGAPVRPTVSAWRKDVMQHGPLGPVSFLGEVLNDLAKTIDARAGADPPLHGRRNC